MGIYHQASATPLFPIGSHALLAKELRWPNAIDLRPFDAKIAGWWVWGICQWIGSGWCAERKPPIQLPHVGNAGMGVHRKRPHVGDAGRGVHRKRPHVGDAGRGVFTELCDRMRHVRVCCGNWDRIMGPSPTFHNGVTGVFLDPPYADTAERNSDLYREDSLSVAHDVREWAIANGDNPMLRIALCGYEGEHVMPAEWECVAWKSTGTRAEQATRERIWFSPHCLRPDKGQLALLEAS